MEYRVVCEDFMEESAIQNVQPIVLNVKQLTNVLRVTLDTTVNYAQRSVRKSVWIVFAARILGHVERAWTDFMVTIAVRMANMVNTVQRALKTAKHVRHIHFAQNVTMVTMV